MDLTGEILAIDGGNPVRMKALPPRLAFGDNELNMIQKVLIYYRELNVDPGYQGKFEEEYCIEFCKMMNGGFADAVATGTSALYVAIAALNLQKGSHVLVSPITDPGTISAIILNGLIPKLVDSKPGSYNIDLEQIKKRMNKKVSAILLVHALGQSSEIEEIAEFSKSMDIKLIEDCSQSHGAMYKGKKVGTFGDIAAFSTMYRKASITGSSGGVVFSKNQEIFNNALAHADRGKPRWLEKFDDRNPSQYLFPALNFNTDEISCAIGIASIARLEETRRSRLVFVSEVFENLEKRSKACLPHLYSPNDSPFIFPIHVKLEKLKVSKLKFAQAILAEGIGLSPHYNYLVFDWPWVKEYLADDFETSNARKVIDSTFNLYLNENYTKEEAEDFFQATEKVEKSYLIK